MKNLVRLLILSIITIGALTVSAQSTDLLEYVKVYKEILGEDGYQLVDEWGEEIGTVNSSLPTERRYYQANKSYEFIGIVDDCSYCAVSLKFAEPGEIPDNVPKANAKITRQGDLTFVGYKTSFNRSGDGYFLLNNESGSSKYMYIMLFEK